MTFTNPLFIVTIYHRVNDFRIAYIAPLCVTFYVQRKVIEISILPVFVYSQRTKSWHHTYTYGICGKKRIYRLPVVVYIKKKLGLGGGGVKEKLK